MTEEFTPSIKSRTTEDLLLIISAPKKWNPRALKLANYELLKRNVDSKKIEHAKYFELKREKNEIQKLANTTFCFFTLNPFDAFINWKEVFIFLFSWELEKDGFIRKYKFQRKYRPIVFLTILILIIYTFAS